MNNKPSEVDRTLDELVGIHEAESRSAWCCLRDDSVRKSVKALISSEIKKFAKRVEDEVIGEDIPLRDPKDHLPNAYQYLKGKNELRAEQRKSLSSLVEEIE